MDRTLVHPPPEVEDLNYVLDPLGKWFFNIPFSAVPEGFVKQLTNCPYTYPQYKKLCPTLDELQTYWNLALIDSEDNMLVFLWGTYEPLEKIMQVLRCSIHPSQFKFKGELLLRVVDLLKQLALALNLDKVVWITNHWEAFLRKLPGVVKLSDAKVMEVY